MKHNAVVGSQIAAKLSQLHHKTQGERGRGGGGGDCLKSVGAVRVDVGKQQSSDAGRDQKVPVCRKLYYVS